MAQHVDTTDRLTRSKQQAELACSSLMDTLFETKNFEKLTQKLHQTLEDVVLKCLDSKVFVDKIGSVIEGTLSGHLNILRNDVDDAMKACENLQARVGVLEGELGMMKKIDEGLRTENNKLKERLNKLEGDCAKDRLANHENFEASERYSRRENLVIMGLPSLNYSDAASSLSTVDSNSALGPPASVKIVEEAVLNMINNDLRVPVQPSDICAAHRIQPRSSRLSTTSGSSLSTGSTSSSSIIVRFTNRRVRDAVFAARKQLKASGKRIFINEHLTQEAAQLFKSARSLMKEKALHSTWTYNGMVFYRLSPDAAPLRIKSPSDLPAARR